MANKSVKKVTLKDARNAAPPTPDLGKLTKQEAAFFDHTENMQTAELGWLGMVWGGKSEKPGNISAVLALILIIYLGAVIFMGSDGAHFEKIFGGLTSIITLILGYLFGSSDRN